jgi:hypothetical protein
MGNIDSHSIAAIPIIMYFNDTELGLGTAFLWTEKNSHYLITNWHNVSGKDPFTGKHTSKTAAEPNKIVAWMHEKTALGSKINKVIPIRDEDGVPKWFIHPTHGNKIDVVALPVPEYQDVEVYAVNLLPESDLLFRVGMDIFILGFPFGLGLGTLPVWKRGSVATEPELVPTDCLHILVDSASRPGMSGSPVFLRSWGGYTYWQT